jgi:hypothetical protein
MRAHLDNPLGFNLNKSIGAHMKKTITTLILALTLSPVFAQSDSIPNHPGIEPSMTQLAGKVPIGTWCGAWSNMIFQLAPCGESALVVGHNGYTHYTYCTNGFIPINLRALNFGWETITSCLKVQD